MSQTQYLFPASADVTPFSPGTTASAAVQLENAGNTLRIVNESATAFFYAIGDDSTVVATLPTAGSITSNYCGPGADFTVSIPSNGRKWISGITRSGTAQANAYVGEGS